MLSYDYPLLGAFFTMLWFFLWIVWLILLFRVFADIFRSDDLGGWSKALWVIFVVFLPFLGVFVYLIARGRKMGERDLEQAQAREEAFRSHVQAVAGSTGGGGTAAELEKLADLKAKGVIDEDDFQKAKAKLLST